MIMRKCDQCGKVEPFLGSDFWSYGFANRGSLESTGPLMWLEIFSNNAGPEEKFRYDVPPGKKFECWKRFDLCSPRCVLGFMEKRFEGAMPFVTP